MVDKKPSGSKRSMSFYPTSEVMTWLEENESENKSRLINKALEEYMERKKTGALFNIPLTFYQMGDLLKFLEEDIEGMDRGFDELHPGDTGYEEYRAAYETRRRLQEHFKQFLS